MRHVSLEVIKGRKKHILDTVIHHYIKTGKPVGSSALIEEYNISLSPATVRKLMADLEGDGYLTHPHTSAGRIPTDKGYRSYVDSLVKLQNFAIEEEERIKREYEQKHGEIEALLSETSRVLSGLSQYTGFVMTPKTRCDQIKSVEFVQISREDLLVVLLTKSGMIKHEKIKACLTCEQMSKLRDFLNEKLRGVSVAQANKKIVLEIRNFRQNEAKIFEIAEKISDVFYNIQDDVYIDGASNGITISSFNDFDLIKSFVNFKEYKEKFIEIINRDFNNDGINVKIGSENILTELKDLSVITTVYNNGECAIGVLGIIGPKRMEYEKMISIVSQVSEVLNRFFREISKQF
ncbi:MAG: heat-inducible transcriptional repressor HrcA [Endomicrobium sp.]|jgi:heat-inducible transcriptional repressor|nr:heat-inducible transcriptional repressor HrcA [Endomicrobium sp.]